MHRRDHPDRPMNPYPDDWQEIGEFAFRSALSLIRPLGSVEARLGEDADYVLQHDLLADVTIDGQVRRLVAPRGLITDLTSVPRPFRILIGRVGPWLEAAILHDYLYIAWQDVPGHVARPRDRLFADKVMLLAMEKARVAPWRRRLIYGAVRLFGESAYRRGSDRRYVDLNDPDLKGKLAFVIRQSGTLSMPEPPQG